MLITFPPVIVVFMGPYLLLTCNARNNRATNNARANVSICYAVVCDKCSDFDTVLLLKSHQPDLTAIRTYFTRLLIRTNSYYLTHTNVYVFFTKS